MKTETNEKFNRLTEILGSMRPLAIAYSGGVDSSLLAGVAAKVLGDDAIGIFLKSPLITRREYQNAVTTAKEIGLRLKVIEFNPFAAEGFASNPKNRCYICKKLIATEIKSFLKTCGIKNLADGQNISDLSEYRPGILAADEEGIFHPFIQSHITKNEIREIAHELGYSFADKPSSACLASRIPYGDGITQNKLRIIEDSEEVLLNLGFTNFRVRLHGSIARIEVKPKDFSGVLEKREYISKEFKNIGFTYVCLDIDGYRSGSMDE